MATTSDIKAIAVDGGGSQCRLAWVTDDGYQSVTTGASNASSDFDATVQHICDGLRMMSADTSVALEDLVSKPAYLGIAGVTGPAVAERLQASLPFERARIQGDQFASLTGALGNGDGVLVHCGTGSFFATQRNSLQKFVGGWGSVLDDIASACWVGKRALSQALYATDGLCQPSELTHQLIKDYDDTAGIVAFASAATPADFGQVAQVVSFYAKQNDPVARQVYADGAALITDTIIKLGWSGDEIICFTGGVGREYETYIPQNMRTKLQPAKGEPLDGAVELAWRYHRELLSVPEKTNTDLNG